MVGSREVKSMNKYTYTLEKGELTIYEGRKVLATISNVKLAQANRLFKEVVYDLRGIDLLMGG